MFAPQTYCSRLLRSCWLLALVSFVLLASACGKQPGLPGPYTPVADLADYKQDPRAYVDTGRPWPEGPQLPAAIQQGQYQDFRRKWLRPWRANPKPISAKNALWGIASYGGKQAWTRDGKKRPKDWTTRIAANCAKGTFPSMQRPGMVLVNANLRVLPTAEPFFLDPSRPGEGYPFDYFQNSAVWAGTPVLVTHQSADHAWWHVEGPFASGWLPRHEVRFVDQGLMDLMQGAQWVSVVAEDVPLKLSSGRQVAPAGVGMVLPVLGQGPVGMKVGFPKPAGMLTGLEPVILSSRDAVTMPLPMTQRTVAEVAAQMQGQLYGWGGIDGKRDCSSMLRDLFTPFGIFLPRNSSQQAKAGDRRAMDMLTGPEKEAVLLKEGLPFRTLVHKKGHIMLYIGQEGGRPLVYHDVWGVRTTEADGSEGRAVMGKIVVTTLSPGAELPQVQRRGKTLVDTLTSFTILPSTN